MLSHLCLQTTKSLSSKITINLTLCYVTVTSALWQGYCYVMKSNVLEPLHNITDALLFLGILKSNFFLYSIIKTKKMDFYSIIEF